MRNAEEHKKLLAQIAELEKSSVNYFDVEKEFFLIDSNNLSQVRPKLYGYSIQATGIYEDDNLTPEAVEGLDGRGCYVYVDIRDGKITIKQDLNGCWGIYLFRHGDYFALSNSFFRLLDHIKFKYPLTVNRDYCHYLLLSLVAIQSDLQTAINEIRCIERNAIINIDIATKKLQIELIDYKEHSIPLDSEEGIAILDRWVEFWSNVLHGIASHTKFIQADLTGGFDTRISWVPLLNSGIDLNKIRINSIKGDFYIYAEDYAIASQIGEHYGFKLNQPVSSCQFLNFSLVDMWNLDLYHQQTFRNSPMLFWQQRKNVDKLYCLTGLSGEVLRKTWHMPPQKFIDNACSVTSHFSHNLAQELTYSIQKIIKSVFRNVCDKYKIKDPESIDIPQYLYHETRSRNHCGKMILGNYLKNVLTIVPFYDPEVQTLQLKSSNCPDYNFLMVLLFERYAPDLLKIPFDKYHEPIDFKNILPYAQKINERFPRRENPNKNSGGGQVFHLQPRDLHTEKILVEGKNNPNIPSGLTPNCLKAVFESSRTYGLFTAYFDEEIYNYVVDFYNNNVFGRYSAMIAVVGITRVLEAVEISQRNRPLYQDMKRFLEEDFCLIHDDVNGQIVNKFSRYFTAKILIRMDKKLEAENLQLISVSDERAKLSKPEWWQQFGVCHIIDSYNGSLEIVAKATVEGKIQIRLSGPYVPNPEDKSKRIPYWVDYTKLTVNGEVILDKLTSVWHDKPYRYTLDVKAGDEIKIQVEWLPHRSDT